MAEENVTLELLLSKFFLRFLQLFGVTSRNSVKTMVVLLIGMKADRVFQCKYIPEHRCTRTGCSKLHVCNFDLEEKHFTLG